MAKKRFYEKDNVSYKITLEYFQKLPQRCQEMFFEFMQSAELSFSNPYTIFDIVSYSNESCKSPIEQMFAMAFNVVNHTYYNGIFTLDSQYEINTDGKRHIADFVFDTAGEFSEWHTSEHDFRLVIECDGHDYHKATKKQVKRDNERDLRLKRAGYDVLHFSGTQICENPWKCAEDTIEYIISKIGKISDCGKVDKWMAENPLE